MPDCVDFTAVVRTAHIEEFSKHLDIDPDFFESMGNGWSRAYEESMPWGGDDACEKAAKAGLEFVAEHGQHYMFPGAWMVGHKGEYFHIVTPQYEGGGDPTIPLKKSKDGWHVHPSDLDTTMEALQIVEQYSSESGAHGFSGVLREEERDLGEQVAELIAHGLNDDEILNRVNFTHKGMLGLVRKLLSDPPED